MNGTFGDGSFCQETLSYQKSPVSKKIAMGQTFGQGNSPTNQVEAIDKP